MSRRTDSLKLALLAAPKPLVITGHDAPDVDSLLSCLMAQHLCERWQIPVRIVIPTIPDTQTLRVLSQMGFDASSMRGGILPTDSVILVDHHAPLRPCHVVAVLDHHPTDFPPDYPHVTIEPCGACAALIARMIEEAGFSLTQEERILAVVALYLDTMALRSSKVLPEEIRWAEENAQALRLDMDWLTREGLDLQDMSLPDEEIALLGKKVFHYGGKKVISTYVQTDDLPENRLAVLLSVLRKEMRRENAARWVFVIQDPVRMRTMEIDLSPDGTENHYQYSRLVSRGKDIMPRVEREMQQEE